MESLLDQFLIELQSPDISSSIGPLIVVISVFLGVSGALIYFILKMVRPPEIVDTENETSSPAPELAYLDSSERLRLFLRRAFNGNEAHGKPGISLEELEALRQKIESLERENASLRDAQARALTRVEEMKNAVAFAEDKQQDLEKTLEKSQQHRTKLQKRNEELEVQLNELLGEVERVYRNNQHAAGKSNAKPPFFQPTPPVDLDIARQMKEKDQEIQCLKELLMICRAQIEAFTSENRPPIKNRA